MKPMKKFLLLFIILLFSFNANSITLQQVTSQMQNSIQKIKFTFDLRYTSKPKLFVAGNNLIIDFSGIKTMSNQQNYTFENGLSSSLNLVTVGQRTRGVINNGALYHYQFAMDNNILTLTLSNGVATKSVTNPEVGLIGLNKANNNNFATQIKDVKFSRDDNGGGVIEIPYSGNSKIEVKDERLGNNLDLTLNGVSFTQDLIKQIDVSDFDTPIKLIDTKSANNKLILHIVNRNQWDYALYQLQNKLMINIRQLNAANSNSSIPSLNENKSDKVSFNFQNIDVRSLLQLLSDFSGYNILVSDSVSGTMSIKLNDVPWDQALQIILTTKGLGMQRNGNIIRIAPMSELASFSKLEYDNQKTQEANEPLETVTVRLKYSKAEQIQSMIEKNGSGSGGSGASGSASTASGEASGGKSSLLSSRGSLLVDNRTNTLIVNDTPSHLKDIMDLVNKIDIPVKQVLIEARIVEANSNFEKDLGMRLLLAGIGGSTTYSNNLENGLTINQGGIGSVSGNGFINQNFGVSGGASLSTIFAPNSNTLIGLEVDALELQSEGRTISSPKIVTANYQAATIQQGVQIPYQQASSAGNTNVSFVNATLSLQVTPQITQDGYVLLKVQVQKDSPNTKLQVQGTPSIDTNSINTQVRVKDGSTILVGGIYIDDQQNVEQKIPLLGDIPYLGWLFKSQSTKTARKELLVFITPRIVTNSLENDN
ncbi:MAG: hypothetical protein RLZZ293_664 [Pseudomonadota bacterium]|jgi:type IV pilus assembly protein PilQ